MASKYVIHVELPPKTLRDLREQAKREKRSQHNLAQLILEIGIGLRVLHYGKEKPSRG